MHLSSGTNFPYDPRRAGIDPLEGSSDDRALDRVRVGQRKRKQLRHVAVLGRGVAGKTQSAEVFAQLVRALSSRRLPAHDVLAVRYLAVCSQLDCELARLRMLLCERFQEALHSFRIRASGIIE